MKKEYMLQRIKKYCDSHDMLLVTPDDNPHLLVYVISWQHDEVTVLEKSFPSLTKLYKYLFN